MNHDFKKLLKRTVFYGGCFVVALSPTFFGAIGVAAILFVITGSGYSALILPASLAGVPAIFAMVSAFRARSLDLSPFVAALVGILLGTLVVYWLFFLVVIEGAGTGGFSHGPSTLTEFAQIVALGLGWWVPFFFILIPASTYSIVATVVMYFRSPRIRRLTAQQHN